jgi:hypothetical protein
MKREVTTINNEVAMLLRVLCLAQTLIHPRQNSVDIPSTPAVVYIIFMSDKAMPYKSKGTGYVRVMVSLNRQGHIVTKYGKYRNITPHNCSASSSLSHVANQHLAVDPATRDNAESELEASCALSREHPK